MQHVQESRSKTIRKAETSSMPQTPARSSKTRTMAKTCSMPRTPIRSVIDILESSGDEKNPPMKTKMELTPEAQQRKMPSRPVEPAFETFEARVEEEVSKRRKSELSTALRKQKKELDELHQQQVAKMGQDANLKRKSELSTALRKQKKELDELHQQQVAKMGQDANLNLLEIREMTDALRVVQFEKNSRIRNCEELQREKEKLQQQLTDEKARSNQLQAEKVTPVMDAVKLLLGEDAAEQLYSCVSAMTHDKCNWDDTEIVEQEFEEIPGPSQPKVLQDDNKWKSMLNRNLAPEYLASWDIIRRNIKSLSKCVADFDNEQATMTDTLKEIDAELLMLAQSVKAKTTQLDHCHIEDSKRIMKSRSETYAKQDMQIKRKKDAIDAWLPPFLVRVDQDMGLASLDKLGQNASIAQEEAKKQSVQEFQKLDKKTKELRICDAEHKEMKNFSKSELDDQLTKLQVDIEKLLDAAHQVAKRHSSILEDVKAHENSEEQFKERRSYIMEERQEFHEAGSRFRVESETQAIIVELAAKAQSIYKHDLHTLLKRIKDAKMDMGKKAQDANRQSSNTRLAAVKGLYEEEKRYTIAKVAIEEEMKAKKMQQQTLSFRNVNRKKIDVITEEIAALRDDGNMVEVEITRIRQQIKDMSEKPVSWLERLGFATLGKRARPE